MGCWGYQILCDDIALDALADLLESDVPEQAISDFLDGMIEEPEEYDTEQYALVAAAAVDASLHGMELAFWDEDAENEDLATLRELLDGLELSDLRGKAAEALRLILSEHSELRQLWEENADEYPAWQKNITELYSRLTEA
ncbi:MAG: DUF4259 domain-containing protein [Butyricicoccaceae bacterium]